MCDKIFAYLSYYYSGGIKLIFTGSDLDVVSTVLIIDIVDNTTNNTVLAMPYNIVSVCPGKFILILIIKIHHSESHNQEK